MYTAFDELPLRPAHRPSGKSCDALLRYADAVLNQDRFARIIDETPPKRNERKYLDTQSWLRKMWTPAEMLGLTDSRPLRVLDLGTGVGHFPFICRYLGHEVVGLDRGDSAFFQAMSRWMSIRTIDHVIRPFAPLPDLGGRFDVVTAFRIGFNIRPDRTTYDIPEWRFLLDHLAGDILRPGGRLCLKFNHSPNRRGRQADDPALRALFAARGASSPPTSRYVLFDPLTPAQNSEAARRAA